jgi:hypothetical protein
MIELKMMAEICSAGGQDRRPDAHREMAKLHPHEYVLVGQSDRDVVDMLRESICSPRRWSAAHIGKRVPRQLPPAARETAVTMAGVSFWGRDAQGRDFLDSRHITWHGRNRF